MGLDVRRRGRMWGAVTAVAVALPLTSCAGPSGSPDRVNTRAGRTTHGAMPMAPVTTPSRPASAPIMAAEVPRCHTGQLSASVGVAVAAAGNIGFPLIVTNISSTSCGLFGYLGLQLDDSSRHFLVNATIRGSSMLFHDPGPRPVRLSPGDSASAGIGYGDVLIGGVDPASGCLLSTYLEVTPPDETTYLFLRARLGPCSAGTVEVTALQPGSEPEGPGD